MPDYQQGKIYNIFNTIGNEIYVGSTCETLSRRMAKHRSFAKSSHNNLIYRHTVKVGVESFHIELIENYSCNDVYELRAREGHFIRGQGTLNNNIAGIKCGKTNEEGLTYYGANQYLWKSRQKNTLRTKQGTP